MLHHHQRRILRQGFAQHRRALHVGADHLVSPPLVRQFVRHDVARKVDLVGIVGVRVEPDGLRIGHGPRERLGEAVVARELDDARIVELVRREVRAVIIQRGAHCGEHLGHVPVVSRMVEDRQLDAPVLLRGKLVIGGLDREEVEDRRAADEVRGAPPVRSHIRHPATRRDWSLVRVGGQRDVRHHPIDPDIIAPGCGQVFELRGTEFRRQMLPAPFGPVA